MENLQSLNPNRSKKALTVLKSIIAILLLPWVYAFTTGFINECKLTGEGISLFIAGIVSFLVTYLFIYDAARIYQAGQKITEVTFRFISPLVKVASFVVPIYSIILFVVYILLSVFIKSTKLGQLFVFLIGFSIMLHLVLSARSLRSRKDDFLMINYLFSFGCIYIVNIVLLALAFSILFEPFSFLSFGKASLEAGKGIYSAVFTQLFL